MAVLGRLLVSSAERLDLPDLLSIDSYAAGDWKYFLKSLVGDSKPYILKGFDVIDPGNAIGTQSCSIRVANSITYYPGSSAGPFYHGLQEGHIQAAPLVPELRKNAVNYVYLTFSTFNTAIDTRAFWDPDKDSGVGGEFTQDVNTESVLKVEVNVSTGSFPANTVPIALITVGPVVITAIEDARDMLFRLGSGGINPDPFSTYAWRSLPSAPYQRVEPSTQMVAGGVNPFQGADKNILTLKEWMDAVMSKLRELGGTAYWYDDTSSFGLISGFFDAVSTLYQSKGQWIHSSATPGLLTWTEDIHIKLASDLREYVIRQGSKQLANEQVMYFSMIRNQPINVTDDPVSWTNGQLYVNTVGGVVGSFSNLAKGDQIKKINDPFGEFLRVEEFYDAVNLGGSVTTAALARSIRLSSVYLGTTSIEKARYDKGAYLSSDVVVSNRDDIAITNAGGNFHWLAMRSDTIENIATVVSSSISLAISEHDGSTAKVTSTAHGLVDGDRLTISGTTNFNGTFKVEVETANIFYITISGGPFANESGTGLYAIATTAARFNAFGFQEESANHGFRSDDTIIIDGTVNFDGSYLVNVRNATQFEFSIGSPPVPPAPPGSPDLATAAPFALLGASTITNTGFTVVTGNLGLYPGTSVTGFPPGVVVGVQHITDATAQQAQIDALAAYTDLSTRPSTVIPSALDSQTLTAGVYSFASGAATLATSGPGTLTFSGSATDIFVIITASTLTTGAGGMPTMSFTGGALASNVYWAVGSSATINVGTAGVFAGTIIAVASVTDTMGGTVNGRLIALNAAITLSAAAIINVAGAGGGSVTETTGTATLARIIIRDEEVTLIQGEISDIGGGAADNIRQFVGMQSLSELFPAYAITPGYNTLDGMQNYNASVTDNLTARVSKLTAMMADKAQDKTVKYLIGPGVTTVTNTTSGPTQNITFTPSGGSLNLVTPGSTGNAAVNLTPAIPLLVNQAAYVTIDRNNPTTPAVQIANLSEVPISENIFVIAVRLTGTTVYLWDGSLVPVGSAPGPGYLNTIVSQNQALKLVEGGTWSWVLGTQTVTWSTDAFVQIPGLANSVNQIVAGSAVLTAGQVAYVDINRVGPGGALTVTVALNSTLAMTTDRFIIARREGNDVIVGLHSMRLIAGESKKLYAGASNETLSAVGLATEVDKGMLRILSQIGGNDKRVILTPIDTVVFDSTIWGNEISGHRMKFDGVQIDLQTGQYYSYGDGTLAGSGALIGSLFTPATFTSPNLSRWYSINLNPGTTNADNTINVVPMVLSGTDASTSIAATKPIFVGKKIGQVLVVATGTGSTINNIGQANIVQLASGGGSGGNNTEPLLIGGGTVSSTGGISGILDFDIVGTFTASESLDGTNTKFAQSITPSTTYAVTSVDFQFGAVAGAPTGNLVVELRANAAGIPGTLLATSTIVPVPTYGIKTFTFNSPFTISSGTTYWLVIVPQAGNNFSGPNQLGIFADPAGTYAGGSLFRFNGVWTNTTKDAYFSVGGLTGTPQLNFTAPLYLEIPGLSFTDNTIPITQSPIVFPNNFDVAYVIPNLSPGGPPLTVVVTNLANVPANAVIIARRDLNDIIVGNSMRLILGESRVLYGESSSLEITRVLGENISINTPVYMSEGAADGGRTAGQIYKLDNTNDFRIQFIGFTSAGGTTGQSVRIRTSGIAVGFVGLTPGLPVYWDAGVLTQVIPSTLNTWQITVGTAISTTEILINPDQAAAAIFITEGGNTETILNNQVTDLAVSGLIFNGALFRSFTVEYWVYRTTNVNEIAESGLMRGVYKTTAATWIMVVGGIAGDAQVVFNITTSGQVTYTSSNLAGTGYAGNIKFTIMNQIGV